MRGVSAEREVSKPLPLRELTADEIAAGEKLASSRTQPVQPVEGARIIWAARLEVDAETVR